MTWLDLTQDKDNFFLLSFILFFFIFLFSISILTITSSKGFSPLLLKLVDTRSYISYKSILKNSYLFYTCIEYKFYCSFLSTGIHNPYFLYLSNIQLLTCISETLGLHNYLSHSQCFLHQGDRSCSVHRYTTQSGITLYGWLLIVPIILLIADHNPDYGY